MKTEASPIKAVVFDWAGTIVDYGSFAPVKAFQDVFRNRGVDLTEKEIRASMGLPKKEHVRALLHSLHVSDFWLGKYNKTPVEKDVEELYQAFEARLFEILPDFAEPVPNAVQVVHDLRKLGIRIGSTTGYTREMISMVADKAKTFGYEPDTIVTPDGLPGGRPNPWMCYQAAINLQVYPLSQMVKVGDTAADIKEGANAGMWTVGVIKGSSELGMSRQEMQNMHSSKLERVMKEAADVFYNAGADGVIGEIGELAEWIQNDLACSQ